MQTLDQKLRQEHQHLLSIEKKTFLQYGTSGFRARADLLPFIALRLGMIVGSKAKDMVLGIMITASHNGIQDNGFKIVQPLGGMLTPEEEQEVQNFYQLEQTPEIAQKSVGEVWVAYDTRPSSKGLSELVIQGIEYSGAKTKDLGVLTTPQCQFLVMSHNQGVDFHDQSYYVNHFSSIFKSLVQQPIQGELIVDCADGVGGIWMGQFAIQLKDILSITVINDGQNVQKLNDGCGSEFVQKSKKLPKNHINHENCRYAAVDGDADRLIYYDLHQNQVRLVEGDRFAILFAKYIAKHITKGRIGIIQTAYANAASTKYIKDTLKLDARFEPTGVKYLHRAAHEYDIGIYFEANGHGAVIVNDKWDGSQELKDFIKLSNQAVGDAITNLLMSEYLLYKLEMTVNDWIDLYHDYPSITTKIAVRNKQIVKTNYDETQIIEPIELKDQVSEILKKFGPDYRVLIRPSGTEDVVRILCEGPQEELTNKLSLQMNELLKSFMDVI